MGILFILIKNYIIKVLKRDIIFHFAFIFLLPLYVNAQEVIETKSLHFQYLNVEDGLSQGTIYSIFQDSRGFLWFGTQNGLNRYDGYSFKIYTNNPEDSLSISNNYILSIAEDRFGYLWIATENGLNRYDYQSQTFKRYFQDSIGGSIIESVIVDKSGIVWAGSKFNGLYRIEIDSKKIENVAIENFRYNRDNINSVNSNLARCIFQDSEGRIWIGTDKGVNLLIDDRKGIFIRVSKVFNESSTVETQIWTIFEGNTGTLFLGSSAGLFSIYKEMNNSYSLIDLSKQKEYAPISTVVISACQDNSDNLWIGCYGGGLYLCEGKTYQSSKVIDIRDKNDLLNKTINTIFIDRSNVLWVGTDTGLLKWVPNYGCFDGYKNQGIGSGSNAGDLTHTFYEDNKSKIWIGTDLNLEIFDPAKKDFDPFDLGNYLENSHSDNGIRSLYQDNHGTFWIGTIWKGLFEMIQERESNKNYEFTQYWFKSVNNPDIYDNSVFKIIEDKWEYLWLATKFGVKRFNKKNGNFSDLEFTLQSKIKPPKSLVYMIYKSPSNPNVFWLGTKYEGLYQVLLGEKENEIAELKHFIPMPNKINSLSSSLVRTIFEDRKGRLWVGTLGEGLNLLNPDSSTFYRFGIKEGLPGNDITGILEDNFGFLWLSTFSGLCRFDPETFDAINFSKSDGLLNVEFNGGAYLKSKSGDLYFGGTNGFDIVYPELVEKNKVPPPVVITGVQLYNKSILNRIDWREKSNAFRLTDDYGTIELSYDENVLSFEFSALDFINPVNNKYAYMMGGIDTSWNFVGTRRFANYSKIPPGEYLFSVKASNNNGVWNNRGESLRIIITPPFWQQLWFRILSIILLLSLLVTLYKYRIKNIEQKKRMLEVQVKERTEAAQKLQGALSEVEELKNKLQAENIYLQDEIKVTHNFENIISTSELFKKILFKVEQVSSTNSTVLIQGESGTGKELLARAIHSLSNRKDKPLIKVNCATLPANLIESELFGHEKGAFTGAFTKESGRFEVANRGTIFLDEIGDLPLELQTKLLRVLQEGEFERLGSTIPIKVDVRIIAATNRDLEQALKDGLFREDLYYRLNVFPIKVPPLRDRKEDIPILVNHFLNKHNKKVGKKIESISPKLMNKLLDYKWPGNVRELENVIERAVIVSRSGNLIFDDSFFRTIKKEDNKEFQSLEEIERSYIVKVLNSTNWRVSGPNGAAKVLGLVPSTLESRMKKLNINRKKNPDI